ncbi:MAG: hypothetical protein FWD66_01235 [Paludibacter sp.]|nr:hypothetical protein [Paludibacter sp.]
MLVRGVGIRDIVPAALRGRGLTKVRAGGALANSHKCLGGHTPPLSQNRSLAAVLSFPCNSPFHL